MMNDKWEDGSRRHAASVNDVHIDATKGFNIQSPQRLSRQRAFLHFHNSLNFHSKNVQNVSRTYFFTYVQNIKQVEAILSEKFEVIELWGLSDVWLRDIVVVNETIKSRKSEKERRKGVKDETELRVT
jgi:hypothetical protein